jgi:hypothetical protein
MNCKDRLIELVRGAKKNTKGANCDLEREHLFADYLIENGVIVLPCKVGDIVWVDDFMWGLIPCKVDRPYHCICGEKGGCTFEMSFIDDDFGKKVFLTKEEAEQKLKGGAKE